MTDLKSSVAPQLDCAALSSSAANSSSSQAKLHLRLSIDAVTALASNGAAGWLGSDPAVSRWNCKLTCAAR